MDCKMIEEIILTDYIDGKLADRKLKEVELHLASCSKCRALASELASINTLLRKNGRETPPPAIWQRVKTEVADIKEGPKAALTQSLFGRVRLALLRLRPAIVATAAAVVILVILTVARLMPNKEIAGSSPAQDELLLMASSNGTASYADYDFGTPEENYFL